MKKLSGTQPTACLMIFSVGGMRPRLSTVTAALDASGGRGAQLSTTTADAGSGISGGLEKAIVTVVKLSRRCPTVKLVDGPVGANTPWDKKFAAVACHSCA